MPQNSPGFVHKLGGGLCVCAFEFYMLQTSLSCWRKWIFWIRFECIFPFFLILSKGPTRNGSWLQTGHCPPKLDTSTFTGSTVAITLQEPQQDRTNREPTPVSMPKSLPLLPIGPPKWSRSFIRLLDSHSLPLLLTSLIISVLRKHRLVIRNPEWAYHTHTRTRLLLGKVVWWKKRRGREKGAKQRKVYRLMKIIFSDSCKLLALASFWRRPQRPPPTPVAYVIVSRGLKNNKLWALGIPSTNPATEQNHGISPQSLSEKKPSIMTGQPTMRILLASHAWP